jgi:hypothetical protein
VKLPFFFSFLFPAAFPLLSFFYFLSIPSGQPLEPSAHLMAACDLPYSNLREKYILALQTISLL